MQPSEIHNRTPYLTPNEKAMGLVEVEMSGDGGVHRYQIIYVIRNDKIASYVTDLGSAIAFPNPPLNIVAMMEHTVEELKDMADEARGRSDVRKRLTELQEESAKDRNIINEFLNRAEAGEKIRRNASHFGPTHKVQRIGYRGSAT